MTLRFNAVDEFLDELRAAGPNVEPVLRLTTRFRRNGGVPIVGLAVLASYLREVSGQVLCVSLVAEVGSQFPGGPMDNDTAVRRDHVYEQLREAATSLSLEIRAGSYEP